MLYTQLHLLDRVSVKSFLYMYEHRMNAVSSTSGGRLFDAVSALLGICKSSSFEGQASTALMYEALTFMRNHSVSTYQDLVNVPEVADLLKEYDQKTLHGVYENRNTEEVTLTIPTDYLFYFLMDQRLAGMDPGLLAAFFHWKLSQLICHQVIRISHETGVEKVAVSGGCYQNRILLEFTMEILEKEHLTVYTHHLVPPNDGGLALGQAYLAAAQIND